MADSVVLKGNKLVITLDVDTEGRPSSTGKTMLHATMNGKQALIINDKPVTVNCNVFTKA